MNWRSVAPDFGRFLLFLALAAAAYFPSRPLFDGEFAAGEGGLNTVILLVGGIYSVMFAFVIFVIWGQFTEVENGVVRECSALRDLLRFADRLQADAGRGIRRAVSDYAHRVFKAEWKALAQRRRDKQADKAFDDLIEAVVTLHTAFADEHDLHQRLIDILRRAGEFREERIAKSLTRIPPTLERLVLTMAAVLLALVFAYPFHHAASGFLCFTLVALVLFLARLVMKDTDNPFDGVCNVSAQPFFELGG
jgi:hypothetical protein